jgi:hypothetical protein
MATRQKGRRPPGAKPRELLKPAGKPFTAERKMKYVELLEATGLKYVSADAVGVDQATVREHAKVDPVFAQACETAQQIWIERNLITESVRRAMNGVDKPIIGGKFKDEIVATERVYSDGLMTVLLKALRPEFRDGPAAVATAGVNAGVMVIPAAPATMGDWQAQFGQAAKGGTRADQPTKPKDKA